MSDIVSRMNALSVNGGNTVGPSSPGGNLNERGEFIVRGGPQDGPIVWNPTTAYIESWEQLPLHPVSKLYILKLKTFVPYLAARCTLSFYTYIFLHIHLRFYRETYNAWTLKVLNRSKDMHSNHLLLVGVMEKLSP